MVRLDPEYKIVPSKKISSSRIKKLISDIGSGVVSRAADDDPAGTDECQKLCSHFSIGQCR
jgi:hypothetical protein